MKVIYQHFDILYPTTLDQGIEILRGIERAARTCYQSDEKITVNSYERMVRMLILRDHGAMLEHGGDIAVKFTTSRAIANELVRHRLASFAQESTRYVRYEDEIEVIGNWVPAYAVPTWNEAMQYAETCYHELLHAECPPEIARDVLPLALATRIVVKANVREWRHILTLRTSRGAHPQMRELMGGLLPALQRLVPIVFDGIRVPPT